MDAPHVLSPADLAEAFQTSSEAKSLDDFGAGEAAAETDPALAPRGWWSVDGSRTKTDGLEDSILLLRDYLVKDHYDVRTGEHCDIHTSADCRRVRRASSDSGKGR